MSRTPLTLIGRRVRLEPLERRHVDDLVSAATGDRSSYGYTRVPDSAATMVDYVDELTAAAEAGQVIPFAQCRLDAAEPVALGCTRLMNLRYWRGRAVPDEVEIGGTWLGAHAQRTGINAEAKLLLLTHAFEEWGVWRVDFATDERNIRSRNALERLGATFEGVLRHHRPAADADVDRPRNSAVYSIIDSEWESVRDRLSARLDQS